MRIPSRFSLAGINVEVVTDNDLVTNSKCIGEARYSKQQIVIDKSAAPTELTEQSFLHEVIHWCFYIMGEDDLRNNERIVDTLAHLLYQYQNTSEYDKDVNGTGLTESNTTNKRQDNPKSARPKK